MTARYRALFRTRQPFSLRSNTDASETPKASQISTSRAALTRFAHDARAGTRCCVPKNDRADLSPINSLDIVVLLRSAA
jgi:hypothetical protein